MSVIAGIASLGLAMNLASRVMPGGQRAEKSEATELLAESLGTRMIDRRDTDGDGVLNVKEFGGPAKAFARLDSDGDGVLIAGELEAGLAKAAAARHALANAGRIISQFDVDRDGLLSQTELGISDESFDMLDKDGDGKIGAREVARAYLRHQQAFEESDGV